MPDSNSHRSLRSWFAHFAARTAVVAGSPVTFFLAVAAIVLWGLTGPYYHYSDTWQLVINTATTIVTFLMVFLIQNTQNRDTRAIHLKLDELIRAVKMAHNEMIDIEKLADEELDELAKHYERFRQAWESRRQRKQPKNAA